MRSILDRCPDQLKLPYYLLTREAVAALINERFGIELSVWTVGRYVARLDLTSQKPRRRAFEQDSEEVRRWLEHRYPGIRDHAKRVRAEMYWADEMGVRSDHVAGRSHGRRGQTPVIPGTGTRFGCSMISAITNREHLVFMVFKGRFVSKVFIDFLSRLHKQVGGRVVVILDSHPVHKSAEVHHWIKGTNGEMELYYLPGYPGYSPELNPDEYLNPELLTWWSRDLTAFPSSGMPDLVMQMQPGARKDGVGPVEFFTECRGARVR